MKKLFSLLLCVAMLVSLASTMGLCAFAAEPADVQAKIQEVTPFDNETGNDPPSDNVYLVYQPEGITLDGANSPVLLILGDKPYTKESAAEAVIELGLDQICVQNQCYALFLGPKGETWAESDLARYHEAINLFGEVLFFRASGLFPNAQMVSSQNIIYVIAEGSGADFAAKYLLDESLVQVFADYAMPIMKFEFSHVPSAMFLCNPTDDGAGIALGDIGVATVVVNGSESLIAALNAANGTDTEAGAVGGKVYYNSSAAYQQNVAVSSDVKDGFDGTMLRTHLNILLNVKRQKSGEQFPLMQSLDWARLGIDEYKLSLPTSETNTVNYQVYIPQDLGTSVEGTVPLVLSFHGGGETADLNMASTLYPVLGKEYGFITVAVDQHFSAGTLLDETNFDQFIAKLFEDYPCIDKTRVYASGMSMGAIKTWTLGLLKTEYFAAIAPFNGVLRGDVSTGAVEVSADGLVIPTFYTAGRITNMAELPNTPEDSAGYVAKHLNLILARNNVNENYAFDESVGNVWGIEPVRTEVTKHSNDYYTMHKNYFADAEGNEYTALVDIENLGHQTFPFVAAEAWQFLKQFSRVDGEIVPVEEKTVEVPVDVTELSIGNDFTGYNTVYIYAPESKLTVVSTYTAPAFIVFGDEAYTAEEAKEVAISSGLAGLAAQEGAVVAIVNPRGDSWAQADAEVYTNLIQKFAGSYLNFVNGVAEDGSILGYYARTYLYGEGSGADFVAANYMKPVVLNWTFPDGFSMSFDYTPTTVTLHNPSVLPETAEPADIAVAVVNGPADAEAKLSALTKYYVVDKTDGTDGFDSKWIAENYQTISGAYRRQVGVLIPMHDYKAEGIEVIEGHYTLASGRPVGYVAYYGTELNVTDKANPVPLMLTFNGGGGTALGQAMQSDWPQVGKAHGFMTVSVDRQEEYEPADIVELLDYLKSVYAIDVSRVYGSGFSMGSVKSWGLFEQYPALFAGLAPMSGSFESPTGEPVDIITPVFYVGGQASPLPELCNQGPNIPARVEYVFKANKIGAYTYNADIDLWWGVKGDISYQVTDKVTFTDSTLNVNLFKSADGKCYTALADATNQSHEVYARNSWAAWDFLKQFSRAADGSVVIEDVTYALASDDGKVADNSYNADKTVTHTVAKGDTLWGIASRYLGAGYKWSAVYEANKGIIKNPNLIFVGQILEIPIK